MTRHTHDGSVFHSAERIGFEPTKPFRGLHAFQACLFNHSSTSPCRFCFSKVEKYQRRKLFLRFADAKVLLSGETAKLFPTIFAKKATRKQMF